MKIFLIYHAETVSTMMHGKIMPVNNDLPILGLAPHNCEDWHYKTGKYIPEGKSYRLYTAPECCCIQTMEELFPGTETLKLNEARAFDFSGLGLKPFWKISQIEFENLIHFSCYDMARQAKEFIKVCQLASKESVIVCCSKAFIYYMYNYINGNENISPYEVINAFNFKFNPLDMMEIDLDKNTINIYNND